MDKWELKPLESIGKIHFGMDRAEVRATLSSEYREFKKTARSRNTTDDFGGYHVFYTPDNKCEAVEVFEGVIVSLNGTEIFPATIDTVKDMIPDLEEDEGSYISPKQSICLTISSGKVESILVGQSGYYD